jgi:hypothetical protein
VAPALAGATTVRHFTEKEMVAHAVVIVRGTVETVAARRHPSGLIVTDVTVRVARLLKASHSSERVTFVQLGGTLDGVTLNVPGRSEYRVGEEVLVFLERDEEDLVEVGVGAGKYSVIRGADGVARIERRLRGVSFVRYDGRRGEAVEPPASGPENLEDFEARLVAQVGG